MPTRYGLGVLLLFSLLMLCAPPSAKADTILVTGATLIIPEGSLITDLYWNDPSIPPGSTGGSWILDFTFADGYGVESGQYEEGDAEMIDFTVPVSDLQLTAVIGGGAPIFFVGASYGNGTSSSYECEYPFPPEICLASPLIFNFSGPDITSGYVASGEGYSGISSMTYTTPEPSSILLLGFGLFGLVGLFWRRRSKSSRLRSDRV